jgi:ribosome-associated protein
LLTQQKTVSKEIKDKLWHVEGTDNEWVLMDYVNIVHFKTIREYYNIESFG